jgi:hypothetical protein
MQVVFDAETFSEKGFGFAFGGFETGRSLMYKIKLEDIDEIASK